MTKDNARIKSLLEAIENDMIVSDDSGMKWYYGRGKIRLVSAELELTDPEEIEENGYHCNNFLDGVEALKKFGYITE